MSKSIKELRERAESGELTEADVVYLKAREGVPTFDVLRKLADDAVFEDEDEPYAELSYAELKDELDLREVEYKGNASADDLRALLIESEEG